MGEWKYRSAFSLPRHYLEVGSELHVPAGLTSGKEPSLSIVEKACQAHESITDLQKPRYKLGKRLLPRTYIIGGYEKNDEGIYD
jgi:hypothetical protein